MSSEKQRSTVHIMKAFKDIQEKGNEYFSIGLVEDDIYRWEVLIFGPRDTPYENGIFRARMTFPITYPDSPPTFRFLSDMWHPNIDTAGNVCISILHKPGEDDYGYETLNERWMPVRHPEGVIISIIALLSNPNCESPANLDAANEYRTDREAYTKKVIRLTMKTLEGD